MITVLTIDEVITALEQGQRSSVFDNAIYYLKKYKNVQTRIEKIALGNIEDTLAKISNPPLTWDEIKSLEMCPVWVEHKLFKGWRLVGWQANDHMMNLVGPYSEQVPLFADDCGKVWNAYRKERI